MFSSRSTAGTKGWEVLHLSVAEDGADRGRRQDELDLRTPTSPSGSSSSPRPPRFTSIGAPRAARRRQTTCTRRLRTAGLLRQPPHFALRPALAHAPAIKEIGCPVDRPPRRERRRLRGAAPPAAPVAPTPRAPRSASRRRARHGAPAARRPPRPLASAPPSRSPPPPAAPAQARRDHPAGAARPRDGRPAGAVHRPARCASRCTRWPSTSSSPPSEKACRSAARCSIACGRRRGYIDAYCTAFESSIAGNRKLTAAVELKGDLGRMAELDEEIAARAAEVAHLTHVCESLEHRA